jgi:hypothetical protein
MAAAPIGVAAAAEDWSPVATVAVSDKWSRRTGTICPHG